MTDPKTIVLVHGLWLHSAAMLLMKQGFSRRGYKVHAYSYPSVRLDLTANAERLIRFCMSRTDGPFHLVGHSMGGLVALTAAERLPRERIGRILLLGTPYADCHAGRTVQRRIPGGTAIIGRCMGQWLRESQRSAARDAYEIGVVAGTGRIGLGRFVAPDLPMPNDGVVAVDETRVPGMRDHIVLPVSHTLMLIAPEVVHQSCAFLQSGTFDHARVPVSSIH